MISVALYFASLETVYILDHWSMVYDVTSTIGLWSITHTRSLVYGLRRILDHWSMIDDVYSTIGLWSMTYTRPLVSDQ